MNRYQLESLIEFIDAKIARAIEDAFGRDSLDEVIALEKAEEKFKEAFPAHLVEKL